VRFGELFSAQNSTTLTPSSLDACARKDEHVLDVSVDAAGDVLLTVHVQPGARRAAVVGLHGDALKVRVTARPVDGRANQAVLALVASALDLPTSSVTLVSGTTSRRKRLRITPATADPAALLTRLRTLAET
jgi:uncharacterized protein (TIGR00251 family)